MDYSTKPPKDRPAACNGAASSGAAVVNSTLRLPTVPALAMQPPVSDRGTLPSLTVLTGPAFGELFTMHTPVAVIGRAPECDLRIDDASISRRHAQLMRAGERFRIEDLGSSNGTFVNGKPISGPTVLSEGDKISFGKLTLARFSLNDAVDEAFQRRLYDAALRDGLTRAYNKRYLIERLHMELSFAQRHGTSLCVVLFDVDHFKRINDAHGHLAGDRVLVELCELLQECIRQEDVLARYGGEEFGVLCRGIVGAQGVVVAERLRQAAAARPIVHEGASIPVTISLGVAAFPEVSAATPEALLAAADRALYAAKRAGRDRVELTSA